MIEVKEFPNRTFASKEELFAELKANKSQLVAIKKATEKRADAVSFGMGSNPNDVNKSEGMAGDPNRLQVKVVINTTNFLDSHGDVHINGIWTKTIKDNNGKGFLHLQEHEREFDKVISDNAQAYVQSVSFKSLGFPYDGKTEALIFDSTIDKKRNEFMLNQYANGWVKNHSVGMRYVKLELAINSEAEWDKEEKAVWDKYYPNVANKELADERGYFWAVTEAKIIEGSAVVMGSNSVTPTIEVKQEPTEVTPNKHEPSDDTQKIEQLKQLLTKF
jgi:hypothetical protein